MADNATPTTPRAHGATSDHLADRRAGKAGLAVAALGVVVLNVAPFMDWVDPAGDADPRTGYATDSLVPFTAYLALGLLLAMLYAASRARRGQHRGLTLVSMAAGLAATVQFVAFAVQPMGGLERGDDLVAQVGVYVAVAGSALWALGSGLLAREVEGDDARTGAVRTAR